MELTAAIEALAQASAGTYSSSAASHKLQVFNDAKATTEGLDATKLDQAGQAICSSTQPANIHDQFAPTIERVLGEVAEGAISHGLTLLLRQWLHTHDQSNEIQTQTKHASQALTQVDQEASVACDQVSHLATAQVAQVCALLGKTNPSDAPEIFAGLVHLGAQIIDEAITTLTEVCSFRDSAMQDIATQLIHDITQVTEEITAAAAKNGIGVIAPLALAGAAVMGGAGQVFIRAGEAMGDFQATVIDQFAPQPEPVAEPPVPKSESVPDSAVVAEKPTPQQSTAPEPTHNATVTSDQSPAVKTESTPPKNAPATEPVSEAVLTPNKNEGSMPQSVTVAETDSPSPASPTPAAQPSSETAGSAGIKVRKAGSW